LYVFDYSQALFNDYVGRLVKIVYVAAGSWTIVHNWHCCQFKPGQGMFCSFVIDCVLSVFVYTKRHKHACHTPSVADLKYIS